MTTGRTVRAHSSTERTGQALQAVQTTHHRRWKYSLLSAYLWGARARARAMAMAAGAGAGAGETKREEGGKGEERNVQYTTDGQ